MRRVPRAIPALLCGLALALVAVGCTPPKSSFSTDNKAFDEAIIKMPAADADLKKLVPEKIQSRGTIEVVTDGTSVPMEFLSGDGETIEGAGRDVFDAVAAKFALRTVWDTMRFEDILSAVETKKYDAGVAEFTITTQRKEKLLMVSYYQTGTQWMVKKDNPLGLTLDTLCGHTIGVQAGVIQLSDDLPKRQAKCPADEPIKIKQLPGQDQTNSALIAGRVDAVITDSVPAGVAVENSPGDLQLLGDAYDVRPVGIVLPKGEEKFAGAMARALTDIKTDGTYEDIIIKWSLPAGIDKFEVNPTVPEEK